MNARHSSPLNEPLSLSGSTRNHRPYITTTSAPASDDQAASDHETDSTSIDDHHHPGPTDAMDEQATPPQADVAEKLAEDPVVSRLITTVASASGSQHTGTTTSATSLFDDEAHERSAVGELDDSRPEHIPDIASIFTEHSAVSQARKDSVFDGLETREILRPSAARPVVPAPSSFSSSSSSSMSEMRMEHREAAADYGDLAAETELPNNGLEDAHTIGPYDSMQDYVNDQPAEDTPAADSAMMKDQDDDSSTILPEAEPAYRYNIKVRTNGKVLDPPSK